MRARGRRADVGRLQSGLLDAAEPVGLPYEDQYILITPHHEIFYEWVSVDVKLVTVIKPY